MQLEVFFSTEYEVGKQMLQRVDVFIPATGT